MLLWPTAGDCTPQHTGGSSRPVHRLPCPLKRLGIHPGRYVQGLSRDWGDQAASANDRDG
jgi:hypothetical protein